MRTDPPEGVPDEFQLVGRVLEDKYRVDAAVDEGGFGIVYRGKHFWRIGPVDRCFLVRARLRRDADRSSSPGRT
ncbi:hypothetical protein JYT28_00880 [Desulfobulbus sp. AH-315-M07]|nr:hypothetical protein [Desulfobulbus sp. AH-315-M07]